MVVSFDPLTLHATRKGPTVWLDFNESHARIASAAVVLSITQVTKPGSGAAVPNLLDAWVAAAGRRGAGNADPVLR